MRLVSEQVFLVKFKDLDMLKKLINIAAVSFCLSMNAYAGDIKIVGKIDLNRPSNKQLGFKSNVDTIALLKLNVSEKAKQSIKHRLHRKAKNVNLGANSSGIISKVDLGMESVPVLNQGRHGTCVTFAVTAGLDAVLKKGDYISQLCQLSLGRYLENHAYLDSGWGGTWSRSVLSQIDVFGIAAKGVEREHNCGGVSEYPMCGPDLTIEESIDDFRQISEKISVNNAAWSSILDIYQISSDNLNPEATLREVKKSLQAGDRVVFGSLLLNFDMGVVGAVGTHNVSNDTWILTPEIIQSIDDQTEFAGHAMLITGYDDNAIATDSLGRIYKGLLKIRNSWGDKIGDKGDFYMSYSYFKGLALEAQRIRALHA